MAKIMKNFKRENLRFDASYCLVGESGREHSPSSPKDLSKLLIGATRLETKIDF